MQSSWIFSALRKSYIGRNLRNEITKWPSYQQIPNPYSSDIFKSRLREALSLFSMTLTMDRDVKQRIRLSKTLKNSCANPVLIIGGGPSAKSITMEQLSLFRKNGGSVAVMNNFFRSEISKTLTPDYYFVVDPDYWNPIYKASEFDRQHLARYIDSCGSQLRVVQPAVFDPISPNHRNYIYVDGRSSQGLIRRARPDKPWGLPAAVALYSISTLKFLGHRDVFFSGLDSNFINFFFVDDLNRVVNRPQGQHFYKDDEDISDYLELLESETNRPLPFRHLADLYYAHGIFLRDLYWLTRDNCINVGNDQSNDSAPRACLLPRNDLDS
jgi:hypothetical protein